MKKEKRILIQKDDFKSRGWAKAASEFNVGELVPVSGSAMYMPVVLLKYILTLQKPDAIIFRYLNDYPLFQKSLLRTMTDLLTIALSKVFFIKVFWICHNVDEETENKYKWLSNLRRSAIIKASIKIFVTDELLLKPAKEFLKVEDSKLESISFGAIDYVDECWNKVNESDEDVINKIDNWCRAQKEKDNNVNIGLWIGMPTDKALVGLDWIANFLSRNPKTALKFLIIGPLKNNKKYLESENYHLIKSSDNVFIVNQYLKYPVDRWKNNSSFIINPLSDYSVAYTAYNAALAKLPILTMGDGFMGEFIEYYKIGFNISVGLDENDLIEMLNNTAFNFQDFLQNKTWLNASIKIFDNVA